MGFLTIGNAVAYASAWVITGIFGGCSVMGA
jgi:hypothetical protein